MMAVDMEIQKSQMGSALSWVNIANLAAYALNMIVTYISITGIFGATNTELSKKYHTLVTPSGWAFSIWGPIFIWEGVFAASQMLPPYRANLVVHAVAPFWWSVCCCQVAWSLVFAQEWITVALVFMLSILASLLGLLWKADSVKCQNLQEFFLLRAPFSLHVGWIIAASAVSANVQADYTMASPSALLALAILSLAVVFAVATLFTFAAPRPDGIICLVAAWALSAVSSELKDAQSLLDPTKHNFVAFDRTELDAVGSAAQALSFACLGLAFVAVVLRWHRTREGPATPNSASKDVSSCVENVTAIGA